MEMVGRRERATRGEVRGSDTVAGWQYQLSGQISIAWWMGEHSEVY